MIFGAPIRTVFVKPFTQFTFCCCHVFLIWNLEGVFCCFFQLLLLCNRANHMVASTELGMQRNKTLLGCRLYSTNMNIGPLTNTHKYCYFNPLTLHIHDMTLRISCKLISSHFELSSFILHTQQIPINHTAMSEVSMPAHFAYYLSRCVSMQNCRTLRLVLALSLINCNFGFATLGLILICWTMHN